MRLALAARTTFQLSLCLMLLSYHGKSPVAQNTERVSGVVTGRVLDEHSHPVVNAVVCVVREDLLMGGVPCTETDQHGRFRFTNLQPSTYVIYASKEEDDYARTNASLFGADSTKVVVPDEPEGKPNVVIQFLTKAGRLNGRIVDGLTNSPIESWEVTLQRFDDPNRSTVVYPNEVDGKGRFTILVPPSTPISIRVKAPGYADWVYAENSANPSSVLQVGSNSTRELIMSLVKAK